MVDLKLIRETLGLTQQELANKCGVIRQTIAEYESGRIKPSVEVAKRLGNALGIEWSKFFEN